MRSTENQSLHHTHRTLGGIPVGREPIFPQGEAFGGLGNLAALLQGLTALSNPPPSGTISPYNITTLLATYDTAVAAVFANPTPATLAALKAAGDALWQYMMDCTNATATQLNKILTALQTPVV